MDAQNPCSRGCADKFGTSKNIKLINLWLLLSNWSMGIINIIRTTQKRISNLTGATIKMNKLIKTNDILNKHENKKYI